ncbi:protocadherin beta-15 [Octopus bimaculoides]|uniref:protocadherin beta-15 n=1 Tax=Octopus bimaculoides TaxID=37653 RepID=UPI0022E196CC|nr:protocadherin beta-15 [Octopus bimaculoides]
MWIYLYIMSFLLKISQCEDLIYHVEEGKMPGTLVGDIAADTHLFDRIPVQEHNLLWFSHLKETIINGSQLFNVSKTGKLYTSQIVDADVLCKFNTECFKMVDIAVRNEESFVKILEIKVVVEDVNDQRPEFPVKQVNIQFDETDGKGTIKFVPTAKDRDVSLINSQITYQLKKDIEKTFSLSITEKTDSTIKLGIVLEGEVDRERKDNYKLQIIATDGGSPSKFGVLDVLITVIDENDNSPIFSQNIYNISISNRNEQNKAIIILSANDIDSGENGKITYHFSSKTSNLAKSYFHLNEKTGEIILKKKVPFVSKKSYKLFVEATDGGNPPSTSTAIVFVHVNNNENSAPVIDINFISKSTGNTAIISEGVKINSFIAYVKVTDNDVGMNGKIICNLRHDKIQLQSLGKKKYKLVVKKSLDRETESHIDLTISCEDKGFPPLQTDHSFSIQVMDINDIQPQFTKATFRFSVYENEEPKFSIGFVNATDPDLVAGSQLTYSLIGSNRHIPFSISDFGFISTTQSLDREKQDLYRFKIMAKDNGIPSLNNTANVVVEVMDKNDNAPYFTFPSFNPFNLDVHYHPQSKSDITTLRASDRDSHVNAFLKYEILGGNNKQLFTVNPYTGVLSFSRTVYQNDAGSYNLILTVKDNGIPVLSATTTLSLTLTVSNTTARMYISEDRESDNRIHINLMIIIVVAAVIVSVAIVVSFIMCIIQRKSTKDSRFTGSVGTHNDILNERRQSEYTCEEISPKYDIPITMLTCTDNFPTTLIREPHSQYETNHCWEGSSIGKHSKTISKRAHPENADSRDYIKGGNGPFNEMPTISGHAESEHDWSERATVQYETLPGTILFIYLFLLV